MAMKTNLRHAWNFLQLLCATLLFTFALTACSDKDDVTEPQDQTVDPNAPTLKPEDYVTIPATGGTVTKEDVAVRFPEGAFSKNAKVGVVKVEEKDVDLKAEDKTSDFYYMKLPADVAKPLTVSLKSEKLKNDEDVYLITYIPVKAMHSPDSIVYAPVSYEATYIDGAYTAEIPAFENSGVDGDVGFSIGLAHRVMFSNNADMNAITRFITDGESEGNISWHYDVGSWYFWSNHQRFSAIIPKLNSYMHEAVRAIHGLNFALRDSVRNIPITFKEFDSPQKWGEFEQHPLSDKKSWLALTDAMVTGAFNEEEVKQTVFHELMHYYQSDYDARCSYKKFKYTGDELMIYEAGGRWIEKFANNGIPPHADYEARIGLFCRGLNNLNDIYKNDADSYEDRWLKTLYNWFGNKGTYYSENKARQSHGYAMGALLEYFSQKYGDDKLVQLYEGWRKNSEGLLTPLQSTYNALYFFASALGSSLFMAGYDDFLLSVFSGKLIPQVNLDDAFTSNTELNADKMKAEISVKCYPFGADVRKVSLKFDNSMSFKGKELVIKNTNPAKSYLHSYVYNRHDIKYTYKYDDTIWEGDSLVIPGDTLENMKNTAGVIPSSKCFYVVTSSYESSKTLDAKLTVELRDTLKTEPIGEIEIDYFSFDAELKAKYTWTYDGADHPQDVGTSYFAFGSTLGYGQDPNTLKITSKMNGTTLHVEGKEEYDHESGGKYSKTFSFDIVNFTGDFKKAKLTNLVTKYSDYYTADEHSESELHLTDVGYKSFSPKNAYYKYNYLTLKSTVGTGLRVTSASASSCWQFSDGTPVSSKATFIPDDSDYAEFEISFRPKEK